MRGALAHNGVVGYSVRNDGSIFKFYRSWKMGHKPRENRLNVRASLHDITPLILQAGVFCEQRGHAFGIPSIKRVSVISLKFEDDGIGPVFWEQGWLRAQREY